MDVHSIGSIEVQWQLRLGLQIKILLSFSLHHSLIAVYPHGSSCTDGEISSTPRNSVVITWNLVTWWPSCLVESHENKELCTVQGAKESNSKWKLTSYGLWFLTTLFLWTCPQNQWAYSELWKCHTLEIMTSNVIKVLGISVFKMVCWCWWFLWARRNPMLLIHCFKINNSLTLWESMYLPSTL